MPPPRALSLLLTLAALALPAEALAALSFRPERGTLPDGAAYAALKPSSWDRRRLLLVAPAQRTATPPAEPGLDHANTLVRSLLEQGWLVATVAARRGGIVLMDSMQDLDRLRATLAANHGPPDRVYVLGESMGAAIAVRMMENYPDDYAGALAIGGAFDLQEPAPTVGVTFAPRRPLLLLPNRSESYAPGEYVKACSGAAVRPVLWKIDRDGRANANAAEKLAALAALVRWVEEGVVPPPGFDGTVPPPVRASEITFSPDRTEGAGRVLSADPLRGDLTLDFQPSDLDALGIARGTLFALVFTDASGAARTTRVLYGQSPRNAKAGDWSALPEAEGWLLLSVHRGNAAAVSGLKPGSEVLLRRLRGN
ncbi:MAG: hypothetical protein C0502_04590 [Opitutus sp.]|nr:hypothetical protein [Opitutus sp.]